MAVELLVIGGGAMGGALVRGAAGPMGANHIAVVDPDSERREQVRAVGARAFESVQEVSNLDEAAIVVLAVKPQVWPQAAPGVRRVVEIASNGRLVISVMAGVTTARLRDALGVRARIVRAMPNLGALVGQGITAVALGAGATDADRGRAAALFQDVGKVLDLDEALMDAFTAVAGSGPAYVFLLAEAMEAAGEAIGLSPADAASAARQTVIGAARLLEGDDRSAAALRRAVTSRGGTTAAALQLLEERGFGAIVAAAIQAARDRGRELGADGG